MKIFSGTGKSKLINDIYAGVDYIVRHSLETHPLRFIVLKTSYTGIASSNIDGFTLHSVFHLDYAQKFVSMSDETRAKMQDMLEDLVVLIIDEISMVKPDMLYQVNSIIDLLIKSVIYLFTDPP